VRRPEPVRAHEAPEPVVAGEILEPKSLGAATEPSRTTGAAIDAPQRRRDIGERDLDAPERRGVGAGEPSHRGEIQHQRTDALLHRPAIEARAPAAPAEHAGAEPARDQLVGSLAVGRRARGPHSLDRLEGRPTRPRKTDRRHPAAAAGESTTAPQLRQHGAPPPASRQLRNLGVLRAGEDRLSEQRRLPSRRLDDGQVAQLLGQGRREQVEQLAPSRSAHGIELRRGQLLRQPCKSVEAIRE